MRTCVHRGQRTVFQHVSAGMELSISGMTANFFFYLISHLDTPYFLKFKLVSHRVTETWSRTHCVPEAGLDPSAFLPLKC